MKFKILLNGVSLFIINYSFSQAPAPNIVLESDQATAYFGYSVSDAGDLNGDGYEDVVVGAYGYDNPEPSEGRVYIYYGTPTGINTTAGTILESNQASAFFGDKVAAAGDVNNDGYDDLIVAATYYDNGQTDEGKVFIYHGSAAGLITTPAVTMESNQASARFGNGISGNGDLNNDGYDDVIVGSYLYDNGQANEGLVYIYMGSATGINPIAAQILEQNQISSYFGRSVSIIGDVNGDNFDDIIVGADGWDNGQTDEGRAFVFHGNSSGVNTTASSIMESDYEDAYFGNSVAGSGDVNNDGFDDVIVGAYYYAYNGKAFVYHGSASGIITTPATTLSDIPGSNYFGKSVSTAGDFNNDGYADVIVGGYLSSNNEGAEGSAFIFFGSPTGISTAIARSFESDQDDAEMGYSVKCTGDINNDGFDDVIVGAHHFDNDQIDEGRAYIFYGNNCLTSTYYPDIDGDLFGDQHPVITCSVPAGYVSNQSDCNDQDALQNPNTVWYTDLDDDRYYNGTGTPIIQCDLPATGYEFDIIGSGDCNDLNNWVYPEAAEQPDALDNDCNGIIDEGIQFDYGGTAIGEGIGDRLGNSISSAGDLNNDGYPDVIVGSYWANDDFTHEGWVYIYLGSATGLNLTPSQILQGNQSSAHFGSSVSGGGDVNADGYDDVIVGAYLYDNGQADEGAAFIYYGYPGGVYTAPATMLESNQVNAEFGGSVSMGGDVNNDGYDDIIVGSMEYTNGNGNEGVVFVYHGSPTGINTTPAVILEKDQNYSLFGICDFAGDVNADGYDDVVVGASDFESGQSQEGRIFVYLGSPSGIFPTPAKSFESNQEFAHLGAAVAGAGDVNNDGYDDIIAGAADYDNGEEDEGRAYIFHGSPTGISVAPATILEINIQDLNYGVGVSGAGDINNDGYDDVLVGQSNFDPYSYLGGSVYVYLGSASGITNSIYAKLDCDKSNAEYGWALSGIGDQNNDGYDDILVGAPEYDSYILEGKIFLYYSDPCLAEPELCNAYDDNCNALVDDGVVETINISAGGATTFCQGGSVLLTATYSGTSIQWKKNGSNIPGATSSTYSSNKSGNYTAVTTSPCGTATSTTITVTVNKNPNASISAGGATTFCAGGSVTLTEVPVGGCTYQWYKGASLIAGATSTNYIAATAGNYKCRVTKTASGCYKNSNVIAVTVPCKEENELIGDDNSFSIYPNPNNGTFNIISNSSFGATSPLEGGQRGVI
ncbi:MAG: FG-GAP-like repeat-containing protein, partial [Chitinophagales bacterium]